MKTTIYTHHTIQTAAAELARLYMKAGNPKGIILGFDANGEIEYGYNNVTSLPVLVVKGEQSTIADFDAAADEEDEADVIACFEWALENRDDIVFGCKPESVDTDIPTLPKGLSIGGEVEYGYNNVTGLPVLVVKGTDMEEFIIKRDNNTSLKFNGELIAAVTSSANNASGSYSGAIDRWTELELYRTAAGKFVAVKIGRTQWQGEHDRYSAAACSSDKEVVDFLGLGWLAKELYDVAKIDYFEQID